jgi:hypothetical protein
MNLRAPILLVILLASATLLWAQDDVALLPSDEHYMVEAEVSDESAEVIGLRW